MPPLLLILLIVLMDLMGFTLVMPLLPRFADDYGFAPWQVGAIMAAFPACQLVAGPILGRLSDRYGRRPVLVLSQAGTSLSFLLMGLTRDFWPLLLARMLDGASGGNILVAQAYIADITPPERRSRGLGLLGAAFGVGFVLGPLLGGLLLSLPVAPEWQSRVPFLVAAAFSTLAWFLVLFLLPESLPAGSRPREKARGGSWGGLARLLGSPRIGALAVVGSLITLAFAALEGTFGVYLKKRLGWSVEQAAFGFAFLGLVGAITQGGLIRPLVKRRGEGPLIVGGLLTLALGLAAMASVTGLATFGVAVLLVGLGYGLASPSASGLISRLTPPEQQGAIFGSLSAMQTIARMTNYALANLLIGWYGPSSPYWVAAGIALLAVGVALPALRRAGREPAAPEIPVAAEI